MISRRQRQRMLNRATREIIRNVLLATTATAFLLAIALGAIHGGH